MIDDPVPALKEQLRQSILSDVGLMDYLGAARMLGVGEARMSNIKHGRLDRFSLQRLIRIMARINRRVELSVIVVAPLPRARIGARCKIREE